MVCYDHYFPGNTGVKPSTLERYETILRLYLKPKFGKRDIRDIKRADILKYLKDMHRNGKSVPVVQMQCSVLSLIFLYALDMEIIENNPTSEIGKSLRLKKSEEHRSAIYPRGIGKAVDLSTS